MPVSKMAKRDQARKKAEEQKAKKKATRTIKATAKTVAPGKKGKPTKRK